MGRLHTTTPRGQGKIPAQCRKSYARQATVAGLVESARQTLIRAGHTPTTTERQEFAGSGPADVVRCQCCQLVCAVSYSLLRMAWGTVTPGCRDWHPLQGCSASCEESGRMMIQ